MVLIAYDGSEQADHAIAVAGALLGGRKAHVVYVWEPAAQPMVLAAGLPTVIDEAEDEQAGRIAAGGAELARRAGFDADGEAVRSGDPAVTLEDAVARLAPELVVLGTRGLHGFQRLLKGSVSQHVCSHVHVPVLVVPSEPGDGER